MLIFFFVISVLSSQIKEYEKYEKMLSSRRDYERRKAVFELKGDTSAIAISLLKKVLDDRDIITRRLVVSALGMTGREDVLEELYVRFSTKTPDIIRADIVRAYINFSTSAVNNYIIEAFKDRSPVVVKEAINVASRLKLEDAKPYILENLDSKDPAVKKASINAVLNFPLTSAVPELKKIFKKDKNREVRLAVFNVLKKLLDKDDSFFEKVLKDKDPFISLKGILFFARNNKEIEIDKVMEYSCSENYEIRYEAVKVMAYFKDNDIVRARLNDMLNDEDERIRALVLSLTGGGK